MLVNAVVYTFPVERADEAEALLLELRDASRQEPGCVSYDVARSLDDPAIFVLHEAWLDEASLEAHYQEEHFVRLGLNGIRTFAKERIGHRCRAL